jgi:Na+(H+)/acetate symporter ActP
MARLQEDTRRVKAEFEAISTPTQVFIWTLVGLGVVIGVLIGAIAAVGIVVEEIEGRDCIEYDDVVYCADGGGAGS